MHLIGTATRRCTPAAPARWPRRAPPQARPRSRHPGWVPGRGRAPAPVPPLDLAGRSLTFEAPDLDTFPCLQLGYEAGRRGGVAPAALNAADEIAVAAFLDGRIGFLDIPRTLAAVLAATPEGEPADVAAVLEADRVASGVAATIVAELARS